MTLHMGTMAAALDHAAELARSTGRRQHVQVHRSWTRQHGFVVWKITDADLKNVPKKART